MSDTQVKNKTIAKNSIYLYIRTFISIIVTLYTSRVFLNQLGFEDYGIYSLVGGIVSIFAMLSHFMTGATQRFLSVEIGKGDTKEMNKVFNISITIHLIIGVILLVVGEIVGMVLINNYLDIPVGKESITRWVFHFALLSSFVTLQGIPFNAIVIARERMSFYAILTIVEVFLRLLITLALVLVVNKLMLYSVLFLMTSLIITSSFIVYSKKKLGIPDYKYYHYKNNDEYKQMLVYSGWSFVGYLASTTREQGMSIVLNIFFGVLLNAAMGVVNQVYAVFTRLFLNLHSAFRPQIIQSAVSDRNRYDNLLNICTFYTILLIGLICTPMIVGCSSVLTLWLGDVPKYAVLFVQLMTIKVLLAAITQCFNITIEAYAQLKECMIASIIISVVVVFLAFLFLKIGFSPVWAILMIIFSELLYLLNRVHYSTKHGICNIKSIVSYCWKALLMVTSFFIVAFVLSSYMNSHLKSIIAMTIIVLLYCFVSILIMKQSQREMIINKVMSYIKH